MNFFLVVYDRRAHRLVSVHPFGTDYATAAAARAQAVQESIDDGDRDREIVLLSAQSLDVLTRTHGRYFMSGNQLIDHMIDAIKPKFPLVQRGDLA